MTTKTKVIDRTSLLYRLLRVYVPEEKLPKTTCEVWAAAIGYSLISVFSFALGAATVLFGILLITVGVHRGPEPGFGWVFVGIGTVALLGLVAVSTQKIWQPFFLRYLCKPVTYV